MINVKNASINFKLKNGLTAFRFGPVNLTFPDKGMFLIEGKSGSGKTTLLNILGLNLTLDHGEVSYNGKNVINLKASDRENFLINNVGFIPQNIELIEEINIEKNLELFLSLKKIKLDKDRVIEYFEKMDLDSSFLTKYPKELSSGEKQRIAIVRSLLLNVSVLLVDEPSSRVNKEITLKIFKLLKEESKNKLIITVSHDTSDIEEFIDGKITIDNGEIINNTISENIESNAVNKKDKLAFSKLFSLLFANLKYKFSKFIGIYLAMILSLGLIIAANNEIYNSWGAKSIDLIVDNGYQLGVTTDNGSFSETLDTDISLLFGNNAAKSISSQKILKNYYGFDELELDKKTRIFQYSDNLETVFHVSLVSGEIPSKELDYMISDIAVYKLLYNETGTSKASYDDIITRYNKLAEDHKELTGLYTCGQDSFKIYTDNVNFNMDFADSYDDYSIYNSVIVKALPEDISSYDSNINEAYTISINSYEAYDNYEKLSLSYIDEYSFENPFQIYSLFATTNKKYYDTAAYAFFGFFGMVYLIFSIVYVFMSKKNHSKEYEALETLGVSKLHVASLSLSEISIMAVILYLLGFAFSFFVEYLYNFLNVLVFGYCLRTAALHHISFAISLIFLFLPILIFFLTKIKSLFAKHR